MFKKFYEDWKKNNVEVFSKAIEGLETQYDKFWESLMKDLQEKKVEVETEIQEKEKELAEKNLQIETLSKEILTISKGIKNEAIKLEELEEKKENSATQYLEYEKKIARISERERAIEVAEAVIKEKRISLTAREISLQDKEKSIRRAYNQSNV